MTLCHEKFLNSNIAAQQSDTVVHTVSDICPACKKAFGYLVRPAVAREKYRQVKQQELSHCCDGQL